MGLIEIIFLIQREFWKWYRSPYKKKIVIIVITIVTRVFLGRNKLVTYKEADDSIEPVNFIRV